MNIELLDASYRAGSHDILTQVNFSLEVPSQAIIVGKSGSGKSSFVRMLTHQMKPSIGIVEQSPTFHEQLSAFDNVLLAAAARGLDKERSTSGALEIFADMGISHIRSVTTNSLSTWERTLVAIARAWIGGTSVIVLDQSFDGHDEVSVRSAIDSLLRINDNERSIVITTSQPSLALLFPAALVYELRDGSLVNISKLPADVLPDEHGEVA